MRKTLLLGAGYPPYKKHMGGVGPDGNQQDWGDLVTVDSNRKTEPTLVHDLNEITLPFADGEFDEIHGYSVLEHVGRQGDIEFFFAQWNEFWRILKPGGWFFGLVPAYTSAWAWGDPGHTRVFTPGSFIFLDKMQYTKQIGITAMSDYEALLGGRYWTPKSIQMGTDELRFVLRKATDATVETEGGSDEIAEGLKKAFATPEMTEKFIAEVKRLSEEGR